MARASQRPLVLRTYTGSHLFNKSFILIRNILIAILVLTCSRFQVGIKTFAGQADRVPAGSVTFQEIGLAIALAFVLARVVGSSSPNSTKSTITISSKDQTPFPYQNNTEIHARREARK